MQDNDMKKLECDNARKLMGETLLRDAVRVYYGALSNANEAFGAVEQVRKKYGLGPLPDPTGGAFVDFKRRMKVFTDHCKATLDIDL